jgi:hypothetical protein
VLANDHDVNGDALSVISVTQPLHGVVLIELDGTITYTPTTDYHGSDSFVYIVSDGNGGLDDAMVTLTVTPVNDDPVAADDAATTDEDIPVNVAVLANDTDVDGDALNAISVTQPLHGVALIELDGTITYTPTTGYHGSDSFVYIVSDGHGGLDEATVTLTVVPANHPPDAVDDSASTIENLAVTVNVLDNDTDADNDTLTVISLTQPLNGVAAVNLDHTITYTPAHGFQGSDSLTYTIGDGQGGFDTATLYLSVTAPPQEAWHYACGSGNLLEVEIIGAGMGNYTVVEHNPQTLTIDDPDGAAFILAQVTLYAISVPPPEAVIISSAHESHELLEPTNSDGGYQYKVLLQATDQITAEVVGASYGSIKTPRAFAAYVFRYGDGAQAHDGQLVHHYVYHDSHSEVLSLPITDTARDVDVTFVVADVESDTRTAVLRAQTGGVLRQVTLSQPNRGDELLIYTLTLPNVPGSADSVEVTLASPSSGGDSLYWSGVNVAAACDPEPVIPPEGRVEEGLQVLYTFQEGSGATVHDVSGAGEPLDLSIADETAVSWTAGGLSIESATLVASAGAASKVINASQASHELSVEAWLIPANATQDGPARIVTLSQDAYHRNFTLGQGLWCSYPPDVYDVRLRTTTTDASGQPSLTTPAGTLSAVLSHVLYTRDAAGVARIYVDGALVMEGTRGGDLSNWASTYRLALANELSLGRPWLGELRLVAVYSRALTAAEVLQNYQAGPGTTTREHATHHLYAFSPASRWR